jgi:hypothetical protein
MWGGRVRERKTHTVKDTHKKQNNTLIIQKKEVVLNNKAILDLYLLKERRKEEEEGRKGIIGTRMWHSIVGVFHLLLLRVSKRNEAIVMCV